MFIHENESELERLQLLLQYMQISYVTANHGYEYYYQSQICKVL